MFLHAFLNFFSARFARKYLIHMHRLEYLELLILFYFCHTDVIRFFLPIWSQQFGK